jgi:hypothetical protein
MPWFIFAMLLITGLVGLLAPDTLVGGLLQILLIGILVAIGINRVRRYGVD